KVGKMYKVEKREDFPFLIEHVLLTTTGGVSTNMQKAVFRAVDDINFTKDMLNSEILVVTDGISKIDPDEMSQKLGNIKLHVLKIGDEVPEPDFYEMEIALSSENIDFDLSSVSFNQIKEHIRQNSGDKSDKATDYEKVVRLWVEQSDKILGDLRRISRKFIQVGDLKSDTVFDISEKNIENIFLMIKKFESLKIKKMNIDEKIAIYRQVFFLGQYVKMLLQNSGKNDAELKGLLHKIEAVKTRLMDDRELFLFIVRSGQYHEDKKKLKLDRKEARKMMKNMKMENKKLTLKEMREAKLMFTFDGEDGGGGGKLLILLLIKFVEFTKKVALYPLGLFRKNEDNDEQEDDES
ncbi:MAG: hypothetical protein WDA74_07125, partial [Spirochaetota bacterium]